jgi:DNA mismatch repair protein MutS
VAQLAGLPRSVIVRAQEVLEELEALRHDSLHGGQAGPTSRMPAGVRRAESLAQLPLFARDDGLRKELAGLEMDGMTPLEAMTKLYELVERAQKGEGSRQ